MPAAHEKMLNDISDYRGILVPLLDIQEYTEMEAQDIQEYPDLCAGAVVLVCGDVSTGKSTFCRFLINSFLSRYNVHDVFVHI